MQKVRYVKDRSKDKFPDLTDGKVYEVEKMTEIPDWDDNLIPAYMLVEDDSDTQVPYEIGIFETVDH